MLNFLKYTGNGNDFIILDNPQIELKASLVEAMCDRHFGIGADGVLVVTDVKDADGRMQIFNADGGEAEMCGNGLRCVATFLGHKLKKDQLTIKTMHGIYPVIKKGNSYAIEMTEISDIQKYDLSSFKEFTRSYFVDTGVPHLAFLCEDALNLDVEEKAPFYRKHAMFPRGTNVNFIEPHGENKAYVRTYERGVEAETFSCGTGLTASALALSHWLGWKGDIHLRTKGGDHIVSLGEKIYFSGDVKLCFKGEYPA